MDISIKTNYFGYIILCLFLKLAWWNTTIMFIFLQMYNWNEIYSMIILCKKKADYLTLVLTFINQLLSRCDNNWTCSQQHNRHLKWINWCISDVNSQILDMTMPAAVCEYDSHATPLHSYMSQKYNLTFNLNVLCGYCGFGILVF